MTYKSLTLYEGQVPSCNSKMEKCAEDQYDFVSVSGSVSGAKYTKSWRKGNPNQQKLKDVWIGPDRNKFRPGIKGFYCSCEIDGTELDGSNRR